jgi:leader peptidase (prepilin peptidase)/N-methyltransferase
LPPIPLFEQFRGDLIQALMAFFSTLLGACVGSFLNVCLHRWKSGGQIFYPPSYCPKCHKSILWYDNIPIISFVLLKAQCRFCQKPISWQYPLVELLTAFLFGLSPLCFSDLILLTVSDIQWRLLPHPFNNLYILTGAVFCFINVFSRVDLYVAASNFVLIGFLLFLTTQFIPKGLGGGDIKMGAALAIWLGLSKTLWALAISFGFGLLLMLPLLVMKKVTKKTMIPFGPFLASGSLLVWFQPELIKRIGIGI